MRYGLALVDLYEIRMHNKNRPGWGGVEKEANLGMLQNRCYIRAGGGLLKAWKQLSRAAFSNIGMMRISELLIIASTRDSILMSLTRSSSRSSRSRRVENRASLPVSLRVMLPS